MTEQANQLHSIRAKIGGNEFEATGTEESVKEHYAAFLAALRATGPAKPPVPSMQDALREALEDPDRVPTNMNRVFETRGELVTLKVMPTGENSYADALLVLLYGFEFLLDQPTVGAVRLIAAARLSGVQTDRIDRLIAVNQQHVMRSGTKKGTRYTLNNPGRIRALQIIEGMFQ